MRPDWHAIEAKETPDPANLPRVIIVICDDKPAKEFAGLIGVLGDFHDTNDPKACTLAMHYRHPTHWIACARFQNYPDAKDNGYAAFAVPRVAWSRNKFQHFAQFWIGPDPGKVRMIIDRIDVTFQ